MPICRTRPRSWPNSSGAGARGTRSSTASAIGDVPIPRDTGDFRLVDRRVLEVFRQLSEDPRFFRGLVSWIGFKQIGVPFVRRRRAAGRTKYRYGRLVRLAFDTITAFSTKPA